MRAAVSHGLATAGLLLRVIDLDAEAFEQFERGNADLGIKRVDEARDKEGDFHKLITGNGARGLGTRKIVANQTGIVGLTKI
jgi:hypothetical protein